MPKETAELAPELAETIQRQGKEAIEKLNAEVGKLNKELTAAEKDLQRVKNEKTDLEAEIVQRQTVKSDLDVEIEKQKVTLKENADAFEAQQESVAEKAGERVQDAEQAEEKARAAEQAEQKALSDHEAAVTETHDEAVKHLDQVVILLKGLKKPEEPKVEPPAPETPTD